MTDPHNRQHRRPPVLDEGIVIGLTDSEMLGLFGAALAEEASRQFITPLGAGDLAGADAVTATPTGTDGVCRIIAFPQNRR